MPVFRFTKGIFQRRWLWLVVAAIVVPTLTLLAVQYRALRTLNQTLPVYRREVLFQYLEAVAQQVLRPLRENATQVLAVPAEAITAHHNGVIQTNGARATVQQAVAGAAEHFARQAFPGAQRYFLVVATRQGERDGDAVFFYNPVSRALEFAEPSDELRAIRVACAAFLIYLRAHNVAVQRDPLGIDRDPAHPMLVRFVFDEAGQPIAIAGFLVNVNWLTREVVPDSIRTQLPVFLPNEAASAVVSLRLDDNTVLYANQPGESGAPEVTQRFAPYFVRYVLGISVRGQTATTWARRSLLLNGALSLTMTLALAGALWLGARATAREMRLSRMKTDFVANISHEFRTPLSSILALAELMRLGRVKDADEVCEFGYYIESQGQRVLQLVNNVLDFARLEAGQKEYQFELTDAREVLDVAVAACAGRVKQSGHAIRTEVEPGLPPLRLDAGAMTLALTNLLDNAIKYAADAPEIQVQLRRQGDEARFIVIDHGPGIAADEQERIFEKFYRVGTGLVHDVKGSGLGLAIVKHIVEAHQGRVTVESTPGGGSAFTIHLPGGESDDA